MAYKTIALKGDPVVVEYTATAVAITPGYLVEITSSGTVQAHSNAGKNAERMFALEDELQGKEIADAYAVSTLIKCGIFKPGDEVYATLKSGQTVVIGSFVESAGDGTLQLAVTESASGATYPESVVGMALEALTASGATRFKIRIM